MYRVKGTCARWALRARAERGCSRTRTGREALRARSSGLEAPATMAGATLNENDGGGPERPAASHARDSGGRTRARDAREGGAACAIVFRFLFR